MNGDLSLILQSPELTFKYGSSGDTGVSASLVLHGTPPFQVYYRTQRDKEPEKEGVKTFANSRGEITLQPSWSGHYVYTFLQLSDANYKRVELNGPTIDQVVHPLASAEFAYAKTKKMISSCSGNIIDVDVHLRVCLAGDTQIPYLVDSYGCRTGNRSMELADSDHWA